MKKNLLSIFALIIAHIAVIIAIISLKIERVGDANYLAVAATLLTGVVAFAVGYSIYMNLSGTRKIAEGIAEDKIVEVIKKINNVSFFASGSGNYAIAHGYYLAKEYHEALRLCNAAIKEFENCNRIDLIKNCNELRDRINDDIKGI